MKFEELEEGVGVAIDSNVFIYHFMGMSAQCANFLERCETRQLRGYTSALVVAEVCHRLMTNEALERKLVAPRNAVRKLAERPDLVRRQDGYQSAVEAISALGIAIEPLTEAIIADALRIQRRYGLLTNDSLIVSSMLRSGIRFLATADRHFASVTEINVVTPSDLSAHR